MVIVVCRPTRNGGCYYSDVSGNGEEGERGDGDKSVQLKVLMVMVINDDEIND